MNIKTLSASLFAALFALVSVGSHAAVTTGNAVYNSEESKDDAKTPTTDTERQNSDDKKDEDKKDEDKKS